MKHIKTTSKSLPVKASVYDPYTAKKNRIFGLP